MIQAANEQIEKTDRQIEATGGQISKLGNRFGGIIECMAVPNLVAKFREIGFELTKTHRNTEAVVNTILSWKLTLFWKTATR
jgi:hypothetical protein